MTKDEILNRLEKIAERWKTEAMSNIPEDYRHNKYMIDKFFRLGDSKYTGLMDCYDEIMDFIVEVRND